MLQLMDGIANHRDVNASGLLRLQHLFDGERAAALPKGLDAIIGVIDVRVEVDDHCTSWCGCSLCQKLLRFEPSLFDGTGAVQPILFDVTSELLGRVADGLKSACDQVALPKSGLGHDGGNRAIDGR